MDGTRIVQEGAVMAGWIVAIMIAAFAFGALVRLGKLPRRSWEVVAAAIVLALAGYALQGRPSLSQAPARPIAANRSTAEALILMRSEMDFTYSRAKPYLVTSDSWSRDGDYGLAASYIQSGIKKNPRDGNLWSALGLQLMLASDGQMSPPAKFAFDQARKYAPNQPAPDYFAGLDALFNGRVDDALALWQGVLAKTPPKAKWRPRLESQIAGLQAAKQRMSNGETVDLQGNE
jgi:cytochrome c-type biogenesis protein CcmH